MRYIFTLLVLAHLSIYSAAQLNSISSPDGSIELSVSFDTRLEWDVRKNGKQIILPSVAGLEMATDEFPSDGDKIKKVEKEQINETVYPVVPHKDSRIPDICNEMTIHFKSGFSLIFRAYNDGVAYRFQDRFQGKCDSAG
ncbi:MAG: glycoside hydrolase family 97 N-terminal domain-containing protein [Bacteroidales bacterium]|nr:glycoside hydrolase family 97 N-terminal domain-containing protein [Bacteroidales bacterium]